jgi:pimeloyl-ACP methyl ester carboxylesterase
MTVCKEILVQRNQHRLYVREYEFFPGSELFLVPGARHFVQMDEPAEVARLILAMPNAGGGIGQDR